MTSIKREFKQVLVNYILGNWVIPDRYENIVQIGSGAFGQVCSGFDKERQMNVAIKKIVRPLQTEVHAQRTYREIRALKHLYHDNIIGLLDLFIPNDESNDLDVYMVTQLMDSDLAAILKNIKLTNSNIQFFVYQLLRGIKYMHSAGIIHRDLKPSNVGINESCELRILDFGLARPVTGITNSMTGYVVTRWYRAPEIMLNWTHYNQTVDVWAIGCIMAEMITGKPLFPGNDCLDQLRRTLAVTGSLAPELLAKLQSDEARNYLLALPAEKKKNFEELFAGADPLAIDLLEKMLELDPDKRITPEQALAHEYLKTYADEDDEPVHSELFDESLDCEHTDLTRWRELLLEEVIGYIPPSVHETTDFEVETT